MTTLHYTRRPIDENQVFLKKEIEKIKVQGLGNIDKVEIGIKEKLNELKEKVTTAKILEKNTVNFEENMKKIVFLKEELDNILSL